MNQDSQHLSQLSVFSYVFGITTAISSSFPLLHVAIGLMLVFFPTALETPDHKPSELEDFFLIPRLFGAFFALFGGAIVLFGWSLGAATIYAGRCLAKRKNYTYCLVVAGFNCLMMPLGTLLGVFTIVVLTKPLVKELFRVEIAEALPLER